MASVKPASMGKNSIYSMAGNYDINKTTDKPYHEAETVDFSTLDISAAVTAANDASALYQELMSLCSELEAIEVSKFKGKSADLIHELLEIIPIYIKDYEKTVNEYTILLRQTKEFLDGAMSNSTLLKEIGNI